MLALMKWNPGHFLRCRTSWGWEMRYVRIGFMRSHGPLFWTLCEARIVLASLLLIGKHIPPSRTTTVCDRWNFLIATVIILWDGSLGKMLYYRIWLWNFCRFCQAIFKKWKGDTHQTFSFHFFVLVIIFIYNVYRR